MTGRAPVTDQELEQWAKVRADDAGHLARELITYRRNPTPSASVVGSSDEAERFRLLARHYMKALGEIAIEDDRDAAQLIACEVLGSNPSPRVQETSDLIKALSRLSDNRHSDGVSSLISPDDRGAIINGCYDLMVASRQAPVPHVVEWQGMVSAPRDGTHILAILYREASDDPDGRRWPAFSEMREIWFKPYRAFGMDLPWHAGDPFDDPSGAGSEHMGDGVPIAWQVLPSANLRALATTSTEGSADGN
ncbi:hypothetical protein PPF1_51 [Rhizobium phage vB_RleM_PPF1]|uniref:hypothetical protein n=1 Tax=Rhizobium phage vB_RleM_PPF1 TaxID=1498228 RepID=UPI00049AED49|nr:hypothetical protein PPF1_51 [Rhizobium phage vB_RleM_PPF1]AID18364.1 hypothetical protein PPF1_51 [Rhizobium phage vB_RleM_PPF1]